MANKLRCLGTAGAAAAGKGPPGGVHSGRKCPSRVLGYGWQNEGKQNVCDRRAKDEFRFRVLSFDTALDRFSVGTMAAKKSPKFQIQPFRDSVKVDPQFAETTWSILKNAIGEIHLRNQGKLSFEELYRFIPFRRCPLMCPFGARFKGCRVLATRSHTCSGTRITWCYTSTVTDSMTGSRRPSWAICNR